ncbi:hypothetical protein Cph01nite_10680 [Cellulomonas phragmiteti]|uniref:Uncharacterized protein n=1 Tax=Cellulomonas phragmiteti TaxID=478780 RepID=A0ABQ4DK44_9CELL|nr:hypothetical protein Cph01nite_10680 [Cellulomonas phragmiteti]
MVDERDVPEVVHGELGFPARADPGQWAGHDPCVGHDHVDRSPRAHDPGGEGRDAAQIGQIHLVHLDVREI